MTIGLKNSLKWVYILGIGTYFLQGIEGLPGLSLFFWLKETLHFTPEKIMYIGSITGLAWLIKPIIGIGIDNFLTKKIWLYLSLLGSIIISLIIGFLPILNLPLLIILLTFASSTTAWRDVTTDGISCIEGKLTETTGKIQAIQWGSITIASIIVGLCGGIIAQFWNYKIAFLSLIPFYLILLFIVNKFQESCPKKNCKNCNQFNSCNRYVHESLVLVTNCPNHSRIIESKSCIESIKSYKELFTNKTFVYACFFLFLYNYSPSFGVPLSFIERDVFGWSKMWMGSLGAIVSGISILGAIFYFHYSKQINLRKWLFASVFVGAISSLCYLYFTPQTAVLYGIVFATVGLFIQLIMLDFMARTSLHGKEAVSFALLCSITNLAATCSSLSGAWLFPIIGLQPLIILSTLTSFACLPLISRLQITQSA
jgi:MFS family permease